jgi:hypothetical protein
VKLDWSPLALQQLEAMGDRAPQQASRLLGAVERLAIHPFPGMYRKLIDGRAGERVMTIPPQAVIYTIARGYLQILMIVDARQRREPW